MLFLSKDESAAWNAMAEQVVTESVLPDRFRGQVRDLLLPVFRLHAGFLLFQRGQEKLGWDWIRAGALEEGEGIMLNAFLSSFLERQKGRLIMPAVAFEDPAPYIHFTGVPDMRKSRKNFAEYSAHSLPCFDRPVRIMDIGCGDGGMLLRLLTQYLESGRIGEIDTILLIDPSKGMIETACRTIGGAFPHVRIQTLNRRIQDVAGSLDSRFDIAVSALAYHHMPVEHKRIHLAELAPWIDHFLLFELDANNDAPEVRTPDLALAAYQSYGRLIDFVFAHDAPLDVVYRCVDCFLMTELVSVLTQPRGVRTDYHMLETQWAALFEEVLAPELTLWNSSVCYSDEYFTLFMMHYGR